MARDGGSADFLAGFIIGGVLGIAIGLLVAPKAGEETREAIMTRGIELTGRLRETTGEAGGATVPVQAAGSVEQAIERARGQVADVLQRGRMTFDQAVEEGREEARRTQQEMQTRYEDQVRRERL